MTPEQKKDLVKAIHQHSPSTFSHGDCIGADEEAHYIARAYSLSIIVRPANLPRQRAYVSGPFLKIYLPEDPLIRNRKLVDDCDLLIAAPSGPEILRSGTWSTVRYARKTKKEVKILCAKPRM